MNMDLSEETINNIKIVKLIMNENFNGVVYMY